jgi:hypothetical protein
MTTFKSIRRWATVVALVAGFGGVHSTRLQAGESPAAKPKPYPLKVCVVSGDKLAKQKDKQYAASFQGQEVKLCSTECVKDFNAQPATYLKKLDRSAAVAKAAHSQAGWTLEGNSLFAVGDAPSRWDWGRSNW